MGGRKEGSKEGMKDGGGGRKKAIKGMEGRAKGRKEKKEGGSKEGK